MKLIVVVFCVAGALAVPDQAPTGVELTPEQSAARAEAAHNGTIGTACTAITNCGRCVLFEDCVWCGEETACVRGTSEGPVDSVCASYEYQFCSDEPCSFYATCGTCTRSPWCGWCGETNQCLAANMRGTPISEDCQFWMHSSCSMGVIGGDMV